MDVSVRVRVKAARHGESSTFGLADFGLKKIQLKKANKHILVSQDQDKTLPIIITLTRTLTLTLIPLIHRIFKIHKFK
jgi:hypothetical protein